MGFYQGDISLLMDDIKTLKPTFFPVVPRLLNRIYDKVSKYIHALTWTSMKNCILFHCIMHFNTQNPQYSVLTKWNFHWFSFPPALLRVSRHKYNHCVRNHK